MKQHIVTIILFAFIVGIFFLAVFGEQVDYVMTEVVKFIHLLPYPWGNVLCAFAFAIVITWCVIRSSREHWPVETDFQNEDKPHCNED